MNDEPKKEAIDGSIAANVADLVQHFGELQKAIDDMRWRMRRGEPIEMKISMYDARRHLNKVKNTLDSIRFAFEYPE